jgi:hypothetical protein
MLKNLTGGPNCQDLIIRENILENIKNLTAQAHVPGI